MERYGQYSAVLRFILADPERRVFRAQRWCYLGSIDDWIDIDYGAIEPLARKIIPRLGKDSFYDL